MREEGLYARGSVAVRPLPPEVYGTAAERVVPLRRLEGGAVGGEDVARHVARDLEKASLHTLQPCVVLSALWQHRMAQYNRDCYLQNPEILTRDCPAMTPEGPQLCTGSSPGVNESRSSLHAGG